jgi:hypothetical protein
MRKLLFGLLVLLLIVAAYLYVTRVGKEVVQPPAEPDQAAEAPAADEQARARYPLPEPPPAAEPPPAGGGGPLPEPLPPLDDSDSLLARTITALLGEQGAALFRPDNIVRRMAVSVDNLPREQVPPQFMALRPPTSPFVAEEQGERIYLLSPLNFPRYQPYVNALESVDAEAAVDAYVRLYPLFQRAFTELGYPLYYFNDRVVVVIDSLLAAPAPQDPVRLERRAVIYRYADAGLEQLPAGQKLLIRMGPANAERVKTKLRQLREALLARVAQARG